MADPNNENNNNEYGPVRNIISVNASGHHIGRKSGFWDFLMTAVVALIVLAGLGSLLIICVLILVMVADVLGVGFSFFR